MLKKPRILVVGSFMMDLIASAERAPNAGETVIGKKFTTAPGGKGVNQAVQCARLGAHVTMGGPGGGRRLWADHDRRGTGGGRGCVPRVRGPGRSPPVWATSSWR